MRLIREGEVEKCVGSGLVGGYRGYYGGYCWSYCSDGHHTEATDIHFLNILNQNKREATSDSSYTVTLLL